MTFGAKVKEIRVSKGLSLKDLEIKCGVSHSYLSQIENGKRESPKFAIVRSLSIGLGVPYVSLLIAAGYLEASDIEDYHEF